MDSKLRQIQDIIVRSFLETISENEKRILDLWRQEDKSHENFYQKVRNASNINRHLQELADINIDRAFRQNQQRLKVIARRRIVWKCLPYAAAVMLFIGCIVLWQKPEAVVEPLIVGQDITPGGHRAELILSDGSLVELVPGMESHLKEGKSEVSILGNEVHYSSEKDDSQTLYHTIRTPLGGEYSVILSDGSVVWLNAMSELRFPVNFTGDERRVELKGEGYFEIKRDTNRPFYVMMGDNQVRVLGTTFNINAYMEESSVQTTLCSGSVCFMDRKMGKSVILKPGDQINCIKDSGKWSVSQVNTALYTAWTRGEFRFDNTRIDEIFNILQRWYRIEVFYSNQQVKTEVFTGKLPRFDNLKTILDIMEKVSDVKFEMKGNILVIK